jgi:hypothetical protein
MTARCSPFSDFVVTICRVIVSDRHSKHQVEMENIRWKEGIDSQKVELSQLEMFVFGVLE